MADMSKSNQFSRYPRTTPPKSGTTYHDRPIPKIQDTWKLEKNNGNLGISNELLLEIFKFYLDDSGPMNDNPRLSRLTSHYQRDNSPLTLTNVCRHWEFIATLTPSLWTSISLENPQKVHVPLVKRWLEYSKYHPLYISISYNQYRNTENRAYRPLKIIRMLMDHGVHLWKSIDIHHFDRPLILFKDIELGSLVALEHAGLYLPCLPEPREIRDRTCFAFLSSPRLSSLKLHGNCPVNPANVLPWDELQDYLACNPPFLIDFLEFCENLQELTVQDVEVAVDEEPETDSDLVVTLPELKKLKVAVFCIAPLLNAIDAPKLLSLEIQPSSGEKYPQATLFAIQEFLNRSECTLQSFHLNAMSLGESELEAWLNVLFVIEEFSNMDNCKIYIDNVSKELKEKFKVSREALCKDVNSHSGLQEVDARLDGDHD